MRRESLHHCDDLRYNIPKWSGAARCMQKLHLQALLFGCRGSCQCSLAFSAYLFCNRYSLHAMLPDPGLQLFELWLVRSIQPCNATAPAETGDTASVHDAAVARSPRKACVEVRHPCSRHGRNELADLFDTCQFRYIAVACMRAVPVSLILLLFNGSNAAHSTLHTRVA